MPQRRLLQATTPIDDGTFILTEFQGGERLSGAFEYKLNFISTVGDIDPFVLLDQPISLQMNHAEYRPRFFNGIVHGLTRLKETNQKLSHYQLLLRPWFYNASLNKNCRIFQKLTVAEIFHEVVKDFSFTSDRFCFKLKSALPKIAYCVQFNETAYHFLSRLLNEAGLFYYYTHTQNAHQMIIVDDVMSLPSYDSDVILFNGNDHRQHLDAWQSIDKMNATSLSAVDYHYPNPNDDLMMHMKNKVTEVNTAESKGFLRDFSYPGYYKTKAQGKKSLTIKQNACTILANYCKASGNYRDFMAGKRFKINDQAVEQQCYYITEIKHHAYDRSYFVDDAAINDDHKLSKSNLPQYYHNSFNCLSTNQAFSRSFAYQRPIARGYQTAQVVGAKGDDLFCDMALSNHPSLGQVKVQFYWDRQGKTDEKCSRWIRTTELLANNGFGSQFLPRMGSEVVVDFTHADPDQPVIIGQTYNRYCLPPFELPLKASISGFKSHTLGSVDSNACHILAFDDATQQEKFIMKASKDYIFSAKHNVGQSISHQAMISIASNQSIESQTLRYVFKGHQKIEIKAGAAHIKMLPGNLSINALAINLN